MLNGNSFVKVVLMCKDLERLIVCIVETCSSEYVVFYS